MPRFQDKVVIVTGSSSGIGAATALLFAKEGARVTITGRKQDKLQEVHDSIVAAGVPEDRILTIVGDLTDEGIQKRLINDTVGRWGHLDVLVNNAGANMNGGKVGFEADDDAYVKTMQVNLRSVIQLVRLARPHLVSSKGEIVNISSIAGLKFASKLAPYYAIAKAGLDQFTRALAIDLIEQGVRVNGVSPGLVKTNFMENSGLNKEQSEKVYDFYCSRRGALPRGSAADPAEIANVIAFLADRAASSFIVGQMIVADGGTSLVVGLATFDFASILSS